MPSRKFNPVRDHHGRIHEEFLVTQYNGRFSADWQSDAKDRYSELIDYVVGKWDDMYPDSTAMPGKPLIENAVKNGINDITRLARDARPTARFPMVGKKESAEVDAKVRQAAVETIDTHARLGRKLRRLYMDYVSAGYVAVCVYYNDKSKYPQYKRLDPKFSYPRVRDGELLDIMVSESIPLYVVEEEYGVDTRIAGKKIDETAQMVDYYGNEEVVTAVLLTSGDRAVSNGATIVSRWKHRLGHVPVAFRQLDSIDGALRGHFDQAGPGLISQNMIVQYLLDYMEQMVHAPLFADGIVNDTDPPGPETVYRRDPTFQGAANITRVAPAAPANQVFMLSQFLAENTRTETTQPFTRVGAVQQSQASGSFVNSTQGQLTSLVRDLQSDMGDFLQDLHTIAMKVDETHLNFSKDLYESVEQTSKYTPKTAFDGHYLHKIEFGATAGIGQGAGDVRVLQHLSARLIDRGTARAQIDYVENEMMMEERIQREANQDAILQRFSTDPRTPLSALLQLDRMLADGKPIAEALEFVEAQVREQEERMIEAEQAKAGGADALPEGQAPPADEAAALEAGATGFGESQVDIGQVLPISQVVTRNPV